MFNSDRIENLEVRKLNDDATLFVSVWGVEADMSDDWAERREYIEPDMFTFNSLMLFIRREGKDDIVLVGAKATGRPGSDFYRADQFFMADGPSNNAAVWGAIEEYVNEAANNGDRDWDADAADYEGDMLYHLRKEA